MTKHVKLKSKGIIATLKELLRDLFQYEDAERISFRERRARSPTTIEVPYKGSPGLVIMEIALKDITLNNM
ncbi:hypothetical protein MSLAZ_3025 [Methanosarcina lacustris Z-7289]|uniref:Uncharacterized protein n=1 Tax=Methanosarcina lacustris Z-7289 TaxID=1434111 RepID=A0A0E3S6Y0_9EURY|nr:hypothetical protein [Methanosarcina lacustris]AKB76286.1 hypothetical protein MSLAZ_3025 [Methanosarcina lacustris Z-7289]